MAKRNLNKNLQAARQTKQDEFYTQLPDIERELRHYKVHFKNKIILCNCDDPRVSNFFHYFSHNFEKLGLKKLVTTCYKSQSVDLFSQNDSERAIYLAYKGNKRNGSVPNPDEIGIKYLKGDGDFRSEECIALLKESDIIVTNPPFSLFQKHLGALIEHKKKFVVIGSLNAITSRLVLTLIRNNEMWLGYGFNNGNAYFKPAHPKEFAAGVYDPETGLVKFRNVTWYTNLDIDKRHQDLILYKSFLGNESDYPKYDNYLAINVDKVRNIPMDYDGVVGVPISFLNNYNPNQFEIVGSDNDVKDGLLPNLVKSGWRGKMDRGYVSGKRLYSRLFIRNKKIHSQGS